MDNNIETEQILRGLYYNPATGYKSAERLYNKALEEGLNVSRKAVKEWLKSQDTFTRYLGEQVQMDLVDMGKHKRDNSGVLDTDCDRDP